MKPSSAAKRPSRVSARNATLLNLLGTPGLGSLLAGRVLEGVGQLLLFLAGFVLFSLWSFGNIVRFYQMTFSEAPPTANNWGNHVWLGVGLCAAAWGWSLLTSLNLQRASALVQLESLESFAAGQIKMDEAGIILKLTTLPQWERAGEVIFRRFEFADFRAAMKFVNAVADLAEQAQHHPDVDIRWNKVTLALTTHEAGGLTEKDFALARQCEALSLRLR